MEYKFQKLDGTFAKVMDKIKVVEFRQKKFEKTLEFYGEDFADLKK